MSFDFNGTFNKSQFDRFMQFARAQLPLVSARITHLEFEKIRIGVPVFKYGDDGAALGYTADPTTSYVAKLLSAYEAQGGNPYLDLTIRLRSDPIYRLRGDQQGMSQLMSNGEAIAQAGLADAESANLMQQAREWLKDVLDARVGHLERKIRRALDYYDQLDDEVKLLTAIVASPDTAGSLEYIAKGIMDLITDGTYRPIYNDNGTDERGTLAYAPFSAFDSGPNSPDDVSRSPRRQDDGAKAGGAV
jgi:hypothetical protein